MNICILKESLYIGGTERSAANISKALANKNNVYMAVWDSKNIQYDYGGTLVDFNLPTHSCMLRKVFNVFLREKKLRQFIDDENIDILFMFLGIGSPLNKIQFKKTLKIISARDFGAMHASYEKYHKALMKSDAMICNSEYTRNFFLKKYPKDDKKVFALYNVINIDFIQKQSLELVDNSYINFIDTHQKNIVATGRFCKEKGFEYLIESFCKLNRIHPEWGLILIGDGEYREYYLNLVDEKSKKNIYFTGYQNNPYKYMVKCDCFVLSSLSEGFPNVLAEAMALKLPVIADNCYSGPAEILRKDMDYEIVKEHFQLCDYGILTPRITEKNNKNAIKELSLAIEFLLSHEDLMEEYAIKSIERASDFSATFAESKLNLIFDVLNNRRQVNN